MNKIALTSFFCVTPETSWINSWFILNITQIALMATFEKISTFGT